ncbi:MAG: peroxide stress protein YaaA [Pseudohongiella sp.]|nr:peroxide stress protein YaaA [Pseudohongiella sp.]MDO9521029.1 peroxide stress protein YaaA [Pseudohongiella sp.]MDP2128963.1 peroxide stress protein YaaA [Pseudohongiella sp.]
MLLVLSPAKSLDFQSPLPSCGQTDTDYSCPEFLDAADKLNRTLRKLSPEDLSGLMSISPKLGELNFERNLNWSVPFTPENARPAIFAFTGDVYVGLDVKSFSHGDLMYAQDHLRILSGLYGLLRPLDLMQAYRLEMGTALKQGKLRSLYAFWGASLGKKLHGTLLTHKQQSLINLASTEYFRAVDRKALGLPVISPVFKDYKNGQYKIISFFAKKARGTMAAYVIKNRIDSLDGIMQFDLDGYRYSSKESTPDTPVFLRKQV